MKKAIYFFNSDVFKSMPYGDSARSEKMLLNSEIAIIGHVVIKYKLKATPFDITDEEILEIKKNFNGIIVIANAL